MVIFSPSGPPLSTTGPNAIGTVTDAGLTLQLRERAVQELTRKNSLVNRVIGTVATAVVPYGGLLLGAANVAMQQQQSPPPEPTNMSLFSSTGGSIDWTGIATSLGNTWLASRQQTSIASPMAPMMQTMGSLPPLIGGAIGTGVMIARGATAVARSAMTYCRRNPAWCAQIGGTAAIAGLIQSGQLPTIRRRRGRGITPKDLRSFRRVANLVKGYCPTVRRIPTRALHVRKTGITHA